MNEHDLSELLEQAGERVQVGSPPIPKLITGAMRQRHRRTWLITVVTAAVAAAAVVATVLLWSLERSTGIDPSVVSPSRVAMPPGTRFVGLGHAAIAVPTEWGTNLVHCGVPQKDTVVIDVGAVELCGTTRPHGVESVEIRQGAPRFDFEATETKQIDGVLAEQQATTCDPGGFGSGAVCTGTVYFPSLQLTFRATSSTSVADVTRILEWIHLVPDRVGVPGFQTINDLHQEAAEAKYLDALHEAGLTAEIQTRRVPGWRPGFVLDVSPAPGTMVEPGAVITVTVVAEPDETGKGTTPAVWFLSPSSLPGKAATSVDVLVGELGCTSGLGAAGNMLPPVVRVTDNEVIIAVATFVRRSDQRCPSHPLAPLTVNLPEPLGERTLIDANGAADDDLESTPSEQYGQPLVVPAHP